MKSFIFGVENFCTVNFIGDEHNENRYKWFSNNVKVWLMNGFSIDKIIHNEEEIFDITNQTNYFELDFNGNKRYFKNLDISTYIINKYSLSSYFRTVDELVTNNMKFLFIIDAGDYVSINDIHLSQKILDLKNSGMCKIVLNTSYEPYSQEQHSFIEILEKFVKKYDLTFDQLKIISGNLIVTNNNECKYEFIPYCYFLEHPWFVQKDVFTTDVHYESGQQKILFNFKEKYRKFININRNILTFDKKILCYNRRPHPHRRFLFYNLYHDDLISKNIYLSLNNQQNFQRLQYNYLYNTTIEESNMINQFYYNNRKNWSFDGEDLNFNLANNFDEIFHKKTFVSVVSETSYVKNVVFFSEKIFKPIYACQPFIISGNAFSLQKLKEFGFKTFDKWWDESYDEEIKFEVRVFKIIEILRNICLKSDKELSDMLNEMEDTLKHNYDVFINTNNNYLIKTFKTIGFENNQRLI
jgi:hypothetical protein